MKKPWDWQMHLLKNRTGSMDKPKQNLSKGVRSHQRRTSRASV
ncbi:MAG: hypothetical protein SAK29_11390 [Scytonema sp. PMC 1069.18]|nr:hypothetical protein [Scytonema sp. PMC 1069.18]MEC4883610.1 hypothetical protein [Scytonema sp. PMC 1070.18]